MKYWFEKDTRAKKAPVMAKSWIASQVHPDLRLMSSLCIYKLSMGVDQIVRPSICLGQSHSWHFGRLGFLLSRHSEFAKFDCIAARSHKIGKIAVARGLCQRLTFPLNRVIGSWGCCRVDAAKHKSNVCIGRPWLQPRAPLLLIFKRALQKRQVWTHTFFGPIFIRRRWAGITSLLN